MRLSIKERQICIKNRKLRYKSLGYRPQLGRLNSLSLKIYTPGGTVLGPYYDNEDGRIDSRIHLYIQNSNGIEKGSWKYKVYGYKV